MAKETDQDQHVLAEQIARLETVRDRMRVKAHLAGMETKQRWQALEAELMSLDAHVPRAIAKGGARVKRLVAMMEALVESLERVGI
jgi:hypothetical protein